MTNRARILANTIYCVKNVRVAVLSRYGTAQDHTYICFSRYKHVPRLLFSAVFYYLLLPQL
jgi:hypothetical protein